MNRAFAYMQAKASELGIAVPSAASVDAAVLGTPEERALLLALEEFPAVVESAAQSLEAHRVTGWLEEAVRLRDAALAASGERPFTVYAQTVIVRDNVGSLSRIVDRARELGLDGLLVQALAPDQYLRDHPFDDATLATLRDQLPALERAAEDGLLMNGTTCRTGAQVNSA